ncbi:MAG: carboxylating nicotinate-nucleotide diphosphorylase [bacterium]
MNPTDLVFPQTPWIADLVRQSLAEDIGTGDVSTQVSIPTDERGVATILARSPGVVAGLPLLELLYGELTGDVTVELLVADGAAVESGDPVATLSGPVARLLSGERAALNFLQHLSGIASLVARYVSEVAGTNCLILDTRKTLPGYRELAKYAVRAGGGFNHRMGLYDRIMFKDNHWAATGGGLATLVAEARRCFPRLAVEIEVDSLAQLEQVLPLQVEWILLDNFDPPCVAQAVAYRDQHDPERRTLLEASGNVDLGTVRQYAEAGVDAVSIGRLTHSAPALDLSLDLERVD